MNQKIKNVIKLFIPSAVLRWNTIRKRKRILSKVTPKNAITFTDKIKLRIKQSADPIIGTKMAMYADKYAVREYVKDKIGEEYLIELLHVCNELTIDIWDSLPDQFVIKTNFGTGPKHCHIVTDKCKESFIEVQDKFRKAMKDNWYIYSQEMAYSFIKRKIIIEEYLSGIEGTKSPDDYKIHCFNNPDKGVDCITQIDRGRYEIIKRNFYNDDLNLINIRYNGAENFELKTLPKKLGEMKNLSKKLLDSMTYARIDWYLVDSKIYFGEITHTHTAGSAKFSPPEADSFLGNKITSNKIFLS